MVSAAVCQPPAASPRNYRVARHLLVQMEGLRIGLFGEGPDPLLLDTQPFGAFTSAPRQNPRDIARSPP
jgi:hypothetical protein